MTGCQQKPALGIQLPFKVSFVYGSPENCKCQTNASTCYLHLHLHFVSTPFNAKGVLWFWSFLDFLLEDTADRGIWTKVLVQLKAALFVAQILHILVLWIRSTHHCCIVPLMKLIFKDQHKDKSPHTSWKKISRNWPDGWN